MSRMIFVNLPAEDLAASTRFYEALGFEKDLRFSGDTASAMIWSDTITFMLLTHDHYTTFSPRPIANAREGSAMLIALSRDSREEVDAMVDAAAAAGGGADVHPAQDMGFMYQRSFEDLDGNIFEPLWMNPEALAG